MVVDYDSPKAVFKAPAATAVLKRPPKSPESMVHSNLMRLYFHLGLARLVSRFIHGISYSDGKTAPGGIFKPPQLLLR